MCFEKNLLIKIILGKKVYTYFLRFCIFIRRINIRNFYFNSIGDIIDHYRKEQIVEGYYLKEPVPMQVSVVFLIAIISILF